MDQYILLWELQVPSIVPHLTASTLGNDTWPRDEVPAFLAYNLPRTRTSPISNCEPGETSMLG
jgi:hypothetical protein